MKKVRLTQKITTRETSSFKLFLEEIREFERFTVDEEYEVALKACDQSLSEREREKAITELVTRNLRFVVSVAKLYVCQENAVEDLVNEGSIGLIQAARRFDPSRGYKFITYAVWWIRRDILSYINRNSRLVRLPNNKLSMLSKMKTEIAELEQHLERTPTYNDILAFMGDTYDADDVKFYFSSERENADSMDAPMRGGEDDSTTTVGDMFADVTFGAADALLTQADSRYNIELLMSKLKNDKQREVMNLLYGLDGEHPKSTIEVALKMDLTRERVRQLKKNSLSILESYVVL